MVETKPEVEKVVENTVCKLTGFEFFKSLGSPQYLVAPMVD